MARQDTRQTSDALLDKLFEEFFGTRFLDGAPSTNTSQAPVSIGIPESGRQVANILEADPEDMG